ncbi:RNA deprotection pyrophosphohydrolase [Bacillus piscicola]|uniref:RNA deprotection pyrophosphohydrolase n=1 Tax=Bacillus piscicola TaxID=1632684 RepID=UPI001F08B41E|nr:nucleoside triphosphatase YtkD [Bacillus piscicola]
MKVYTFRDFNKNEVDLAFTKNYFSEEPGHVWVVSRHVNEWLLTNHTRRGLEFPGGKIEIGESAKEAAVREVWEETGGVIRDISEIGQYRVQGKAETITKSLFYADIKRIEKKEDYLETKGPVLVKCLPENIKNNPLYSFIMKDDVLIHALHVTEKFRE